MFGRMSEIFANEHKVMKNYLNGWNEVLAERKPNHFRIEITVSNVGKFDTYIRKRIAVAIGAKNSKEKIRLNLTAQEVANDGGRNHRYLSVGTRSASTFSFYATVDGKDSERILGAYNSGLNYMRVAAMGGSGEWEKFVFSPIVPFSKDAKIQTEQKLENVRIDF